MQTTNEGLSQADVNAGKTLAPKAPLKAGQKLTVERFKFDDAHKELLGTYERSLTEQVEDRLNGTGELVDRVTYYFRRKDGSRVAVVASAGLQRSMLDADVNPGDTVRIVWCGKVAIKGTAKTVNQFDIFAA